jgi:hypothetical protein
VNETITCSAFFSFRISDHFHVPAKQTNLQSQEPEPHRSKKDADVSKFDETLTFAADVSKFDETRTFASQEILLPHNYQNRLGIVGGQSPR